MDFDDLRRKFGAIIGESVPPQGLEHMLKGDRDGRFQQKQMISAIIAIYNYLEANAGHHTQPTTDKTVQPSE